MNFDSLNYNINKSILYSGLTKHIMNNMEQLKELLKLMEKLTNLALHQWETTAMVLLSLQTNNNKF